MIRCTVDMALEQFVAIVSDASKEQYHLTRIPEKTKMATVWGFCL